MIINDFEAIRQRVKDLEYPPIRVSAEEETPLYPTAQHRKEARERNWECGCGHPENSILCDLWDCPITLGRNINA